MKSFRLYPLLLAVLILTGCKKDDQVAAKKYEELAGDYDYEYSYFSNSYSDFNTIGHYGIRIKNNGKVLFFKEGKLQFKGYLSDEYISYPQYNYGLVLKVSGDAYSIGVSGEEIFVDKFPIDSRNYFIRK